MTVMEYTGPSQMRIGWPGVSGAQAYLREHRTKVGGSLELGHEVALDHEVAAPVSDLLHHKGKVGWNRSASQKFYPLPSPNNDLRIFGLTLSIKDGKVVHLFSATCAFVGDRQGVAIL